MPTRLTGQDFTKCKIYLDFFDQWSKLSADDRLILRPYLDRLKAQWRAAASLESRLWELSEKNDAIDPTEA